MATHFKGPVVSENGFQAGAAGSEIALIKKGTVSVTVAALAAGAEADVTVTVSGAAAGDIALVTPTNAAAETGLAIIACWVSAADTTKIRMSNVNAAAALVGSTEAWAYCIIR